MPDDLIYEYNKADRRDVLRHAKALEGKVVGDVYRLEQTGKQRPEMLEYYAEIHMTGGTTDDGTVVRKDKGRIGNLVQEVYFDIPRNNDSEYDIQECQVELKVSKLKIKPRAGLSVQERLILGMINRDDELPEVFEDSHIYHKCRIIMLVYYINKEQEGLLPFQFPFYKSAYMTIPEADMEIIRRDYAYIRRCVNEGRYGDLHEHSAMYLSPAPKNQGRAYSFKQSYMNQLFREYINANRVLYDPETDEETFQIINQYENIVAEPELLRETSFEDIVMQRFTPFIGMSMVEIRRHVLNEVQFEAWYTARHQQMDDGKMPDKAEFARTTMLMLGISGNKAEEFVRANICVKTLRINSDGSMNEDISFPAFEFGDLMEETWEESRCYSDMVDRRFLWSIFQEVNGDFVFKGAKFWSMPPEDEATIHAGWDDIRNIIANGVQFAKRVKSDGTFAVTERGASVILNNFPDSKNTNPRTQNHRQCPAGAPMNRIISVRPHTQKVYYDLQSIGYSDTENPRCNGSALPNGDIMTKQCFWFNNDYILEQIQDLI